MLVCNVSVRPKRSAIAADLTETAAALDLPGSGNVVFATLVDDPASVADRVDAYFGQIIVEAANATATVTTGLTYVAAIVEQAIAADAPNATVISTVLMRSAMIAVPALINSSVMRQANAHGIMVNT